MAIIRPKSVEQQRRTGWAIVALSVALIALIVLGVDFERLIDEVLSNL